MVSGFLKQPLSYAFIIVLQFSLFLNPGNAEAGSAQATDDAFAALLNSPGGKPENGNWNTPIPTDFMIGDEKQLIAYLDKKVKQGADINAYRHLGTLLHHAIRANQLDVAKWLLERGADPHKKIYPNGEDVFGLSETYKRDQITSLLIKNYGFHDTATAFLNPNPPVVIKSQSSPVISNEESPKAKFYRLLQKGDNLTKADLKSLHDYLLSSVEHEFLIEQSPLFNDWLLAIDKLPENVFLSLMSDEPMQIRFAYVAMKSTKAADKFIKIPATVLEPHIQNLINAFARYSWHTINSKTNNPDDISSEQYSVSAGLWKSILSNRKTSFDYSEFPKLPSQVQSEIFPLLFSTGFKSKNSIEALGCRLSDMPFDEFKQHWDLLSNTFVDLRSTAPALVAATYRNIGYQEGSVCFRRNVAEKLAFLRDKNILAPIEGINESQLSQITPDARVQLTNFLPTTEDKNKPVRFERVSINCKKNFNDKIYQELLKTFPPTYVEDYLKAGVTTSIEAVELPGDSQCGWLVSSEMTHSNGLLLDSFTGPEGLGSTRCGGRGITMELWQLGKDGNVIVTKQEAIEATSNIDQVEMFPVIDKTTGKKYYLQFVAYQICTNPRFSMPNVLEWKMSDKGLQLMPLPLTNELKNSLLHQCMFNDDFDIQCKDLPIWFTENIPSAAMGVSTNVDTNVFAPLDAINFFHKVQHETYLKAVLDLNVPVLNQLMQEGVPGQWTAEAIIAISKSDMGLVEKRKRTAYIFHDHTQLARALATYNYKLFKALISWLPREDWWPIYSVVPPQASESDLLHYAIEVATEQGKKDLVCDMNRARGLICGEQIEATSF